MADKFTAAESIRRLAVQYQSMVEAADALESVGKLEQTIAEATKARDAAVAEAEAAKDELKAAKDEIKAAKDKAADIVAKANEQALAKLGEADQKAQSILDGAAAKANEIVAGATVSADQQKAAVAGQIAELTSSKLKLEQDIAGLNAAGEAKKKEADDIESRLAKAQAQIAKLLG